MRVYGARAYHAESDRAAPTLLLGYGGMAESEIEAGVKRLARIVRDAGGAGQAAR